MFNYNTTQQEVNNNYRVVLVLLNINLSFCFLLSNQFEHLITIRSLQLLIFTLIYFS